MGKRVEHMLVYSLILNTFPLITLKHQSTYCLSIILLALYSGSVLSSAHTVGQRQGVHPRQVNDSSHIPFFDNLASPFFWALGGHQSTLRNTTQRSVWPWVQPRTFLLRALTSHLSFTTCRSQNMLSKIHLSIPLIISYFSFSSPGVSICKTARCSPEWLFYYLDGFKITVLSAVLWGIELTKCLLYEVKQVSKDLLSQLVFWTVMKQHFSLLRYIVKPISPNTKNLFLFLCIQIIVK